MVREWYYLVNGKQVGPVSEDELKQLAIAGNLQQTHMVWKQGMAQWVLARSVASIFQQTNTPIPTGPANPPELVRAPTPQPGNAATFQPYFQGMAGYYWDPCRIYRVYIRPQKLYFIFITKQDHAFRGLGSSIGGAVGGLVEGLIIMGGTSEKQRARLRRMAELPPEELLGDHKFNYTAEPGDLTNVTVGSAGFVDFICHVPPGQGVFRFRHKTQGKFRIGFSSVEDRKVAVKYLPALFDQTIVIPEKWVEKV